MSVPDYNLHAFDNTLTTSQYYAILHPFSISERANPLQTGHVVTRQEYLYETQI
jgi:hypothetical protein